MKLKSIQFDDDSNPSLVLVEMTTAEAAYIARITGRHSPNSANEIMPGGAVLNSSIGDALVGDLFNRFYEDGYDEYIAARP